MNHWLQQATAASPAKRQPKTPEATRQNKPPRKCHSPAAERVKALVKRQPIGAWFSASDVFDDSICSVDYARTILKSMAERGELVKQFRPEVSKHAGQCDQTYHKWMFKREK